MKREPLKSLPDWETIPDDEEYSRVTLIGRYLNNEELYLSPRNYLEPIAASSNKHTRSTAYNKSIIRPKIAEDRLGFCVITPFELDDGRKILVNRGYIGQNYMDIETRKDGQIEDFHEITGIFMKSDVSFTGEV